MVARVQRAAGIVHKGRSQVDADIDQSAVVDRLLLASRVNHDEGHTDGLFVEDHLLVPFVRADAITMIAGEHYHGVIQFPRCFERVKNFADLSIHHLRHTVVGPAVLAPSFGLPVDDWEGAAGGRVGLELADDRWFILGDFKIARKRRALVGRWRWRELFRGRRPTRPVRKAELGHRGETSRIGSNLRNKLVEVAGREHAFVSRLITVNAFVGALIIEA